VDTNAVGFYALRILMPFG